MRAAFQETMQLEAFGAIFDANVRSMYVVTAIKEVLCLEEKTLKTLFYIFMNTCVI